MNQVADYVVLKSGKWCKSNLAQNVTVQYWVLEWDCAVLSFGMWLCSIEFWNGTVQYHVGEGHSVLGHHQGDIKGSLVSGFIPTGEGSTGISGLGKEGERRGREERRRGRGRGKGKERREGGKKRRGEVDDKRQGVVAICPISKELSVRQTETER